MARTSLASNPAMALAPTEPQKVILLPRRAVGPAPTGAADGAAPAPQVPQRGPSAPLGGQLPVDSPDAIALDAPNPGTSSGLLRAVLSDLGRYEILGHLGTGGMGTVYRAQDRKLCRIVALKVIKIRDEHLIARLLREARALARIEHELVCKVYEVGESNGHAFIAMQLIEGQPLSETYEQMALADKVAILASVSEAVHAAHQCGIIHRDLKPSSRNPTKRFQKI